MNRREFKTATEAFRVAAQLAASGHSCKLGRDTGKRWHVAID